MADDRPIIIIKKVKKGGGGHHGGAWKVAYADFVTAMMAFFLLLWLLNVTTDVQKFGIANYFDPVSISRSFSGSGGVLGGKSMMKDGAMVSPTSPLGVDLNMPGISSTKPTVEADRDDDVLNEFDPNKPGKTSRLDLKSSIGESSEKTGESISVSDKELDALQEARDSEAFEKAEKALREELTKTPELAKLSPHILIDKTPEGLRIQVIDQKGRSMFPSGSANMYETTKKLIKTVAKAIKNMPNRISITGHTDSTKYRPGARYDNWNLSADRANASRKVLIESGLSSERISHVVGKADTQHLVKDDPTSPRNRRVSIVLLKKDYIKGYDATKIPTDEDLPPASTSRVKPSDALNYNKK